MPVANVFNLSIAAGVVPQQWKAAVITPIPKVSQPSQPSDFRPISITPIVSRVMEKCVVRSYIYPALQDPPAGLDFRDQYAFRQSCSTTAALISLIHTVLSLLGTKYVCIIVLDFSKAFDTVRHSKLFDKLSMMNLLDAVYNWIQDFYSGQTHCTRYGGDISQLTTILASNVLGSGLGPASFIVTNADLQPVHGGNSILKYADDTYLVVLDANEDTYESELMHVYDWAAANNLTLNCAKSKELVFCVRGCAEGLCNLHHRAAELSASKVSAFSVLWLMTG